MRNNPFPIIDLVATGANITRLRKEAKLTVKDLQTYFGFSDPQAIYQWQSGTTLPSVDNLCALSKILDVTIDEILVLKEPLELSVKANNKRNKPYKLLLFLMAS